MEHVFVSYSRIDGETVDHIVARPEQDGFNVCTDREDIKGGELWREAIVQAVDHADAFVLMLSPGSAVSDNVRKEVDLAESAHKEIVPILLAPVELPANLRYQLAGIQWIEYYRDPEAKSNELVETLQIHQQKFTPYHTPEISEPDLIVGEIKISALGAEKQEELFN